ncbi:hypothetical protein V6Z11_A01G164100 [Gossypium hirsutum]
MTYRSRYADSQRASPFFQFLQRLRNSSGKGGNLFLPSSSFILSDVSLPLIAEDPKISSLSHI